MIIFNSEYSNTRANISNNMTYMQQDHKTRFNIPFIYLKYSFLGFNWFLNVQTACRMSTSLPDTLSFIHKQTNQQTGPHKYRITAFPPRFLLNAIKLISKSENWRGEWHNETELSPLPAQHCFSQSADTPNTLAQIPGIIQRCSSHMDLATVQHKAVVALFHKTTCFH